MKAKVAINGFGRVGRQTLKLLLKKYPQYEIVAINDITTPATLVHLLKYDSIYGRFSPKIELKGEKMVIDGTKEILLLAQSDPSLLPWEELGVDVLIESTGKFTDATKAQLHIKAGAKKILITAPAKNEDITIVLGVNEHLYNPATHHIISNASCTTNCLAPLVKVIHQNFNIIKAAMTTIHSYTNDQRILDFPHKDLRRARAAALNMIPTTTGAAKAIGLVIPELKGKIDGIAVRVPTPTSSLVDLVALVSRETNKEEVISVLKKSASGELRGYLACTEEPLVSSDFIGDEASSIVDLLSIMVVNGNLIKVMSWYDNEWGYCARVADLVHYIIEKGI